MLWSFLLDGCARWSFLLDVHARVCGSATLAEGRWHLGMEAGR